MDRLSIVTLNGDPFAELGAEHAGGQSKYVRELSRHLLLKGWSIHIVTLGTTDRHGREQVAPNLVITRLMRPSGRPYDYDIDESGIRHISRAMRPVVDGEEFTAVLACYWLSALAVLEMNCELPLVTTFCSLAHFKMAADPTKDLQRRVEAEKLIGKRSRAIIATNTAERDVLEQEYGLSGDRIYIVPRGVDISAFTCISQAH